MLRLILSAAILFMGSGSLRAEVIISEFLADNASGITDEDGQREDWIELYNTGPDAVSLNGWWITDDVTQTTRWQFPNVSISGGGTLVIWASGKDRRVVGQPLHTNFSLKKSGEYLGLYKPAAVGGQPELVNHFSPMFPAQASDVSYGRSVVAGGEVGVLPSASAGKFKVPGSAAQFSGTNYGAGDLGNGNVNGWNRSLAFNDAGWSDCITGLGYDTGGNLNPLINTNVQAAMKDINSSVLMRLKFNVADPSAYTHFKLRLKYEDGCAVYLNGGATPVASYSAPATLAYNSVATGNGTTARWQQWWETTIPVSSILTGDNLLAIHGLNLTANSSDFLILPEVVGAGAGVVGASGYFSEASPGAVNGALVSGPVVHSANPDDPNIPRPTGTAASAPLAVSVKVIQTQHAISSVRVIPRVMFNPESAAITMLDNGVAPDLVSGDKVFTANIPTNSLGYGEMLRWRFEVRDSVNNVSRLPAFLIPDDSPEYYGTVALRDDLAHTQLPVMDWFVEDAPSIGPTVAPFRGSMYFLGEFYDNIGHEIHGQSTATFEKKSYDFDSNDGKRFLWKAGERRVKDLNLLSNFADKTKTRNTLCHEVGKLMGAPYHFCHPVRMHLNGSFHGVMDMVEDGDDRMLERNGLDPEGALYKIYNIAPNVSAEKKTRKLEPNTDLDTFTAALNLSTPLATRRTYAYDNINIPAAVNYLVTRQLNSDTDHGHKNYYLYRDTNLTGEWSPLIWDVDLSYGHQWNVTNKYFDDGLVTTTRLSAGNNILYSLLWNVPEFQQMLARRMRTAMDQILQPPGTSNGFLETRMRAIAASIDPDPANPSPLTDGDLDRAKWGMNPNFLDNRPREEVERVISGFIEPRRSYVFTNYGSVNGTPYPTTPQSVTTNSVVIDSLDFLPPGENQNPEYIILKNTTANAVDISGWTLDGAVDHTFIGGTVIPSGAGTAAVEYKGLLHVVKNAFAFRSRTTGPKGGEKRLVQGNYRGQLSARGETVNLRSDTGQLISTYSYVGAPTVLQRYLRISEIQYHPADPTPSETSALPGVRDNDFEYIEFVNIGQSTIDLTGAAFTAGLDYTFGAVSLVSGGRVVLAKNPTAFALRYPGSPALVVGPFEGDLDNGGERLEIADAVGENILDFEYKDGWYHATDGSGRSLVHRDPAGISHDDFGNAVSWGISGDPLGSPGLPDVSLAQGFYGWDNFHFSETERNNALLSGPAADADGDGRSNAAEYALGTNPRVADQPVMEFTWSMDGPVRRPALRFRRPKGAVDVDYRLLCGESLDSWPVEVTAASASSPVTGEVEEVIFRDTADSSAPGRFLRLKYTVSP